MSYGRIHFQCMAVAYYIPRAIYFQIAEPIIAIPFLYGIIVFHKTAIIRHFSDFRICTAKEFIIRGVIYRIYVEVIQTRRYASLIL